MKDPMRLSECAAESELRLVHALQDPAQDLRPSDDARARMAAAIGIGAIGLGASAAVGAATSGVAAASQTSAAAGAGATVGAKSAAWLGGLGVGKLVGVVALGGVLASVAVAGRGTVGSKGPLSASSLAPEGPRRAPTSPVAVAAPARASLAKPPIAEPAVMASPLAGLAVALKPSGPGHSPDPLASEGASRVASSASSDSRDPSLARGRGVSPGTAATTLPHGLSLGDETAELDAAQRALDADRVAEASALLDRHDRDFPNPVLDLEASFLRIEVLVAQGNTEQARARGRSFLFAHPGAPQARRVQTLLARIDAADPNP